MDEIIKTLRETANKLEVQAGVQKLADMEKEMENLKLKRGIETLQDVIQMKGSAHKDIVDSLKDAITALRGSKKPEEKPK